MLRVAENLEVEMQSLENFCTTEFRNDCDLWQSSHSHHPPKSATQKTDSANLVQWLLFIYNEPNEDFANELEAISHAQ